jgi:hypothetical protein
MDDNKWAWGFKGVCYSSYTPSETMLSDYFGNYPWYEAYDETKEYTKDKFTHDYGKYGPKEYKHKAYCLRNTETNSIERYIVAEEILSMEDRKKLSPYCRCELCRASWCNPVKYFTCPCCAGHISEDSFLGDSAHVIEKTRQYMIKHKITL